MSTGALQWPVAAYIHESRFVRARTLNAPYPREFGTVSIEKGAPASRHYLRCCGYAGDDEDRTDGAQKLGF